MASLGFAADLAMYGPAQCAERCVSRAESFEYCRRLARTHYENFHVATLLVPRELRPHFYAVYSYCRWADDLADELSSTAESLSLLDWWEAQLRDCYAGRAVHPVFIALQPTIERFAIPIEPFADLLIAFRQDQRVTRYASHGEVLGYCRYSANPVGRLVLYLAEVHDERSGALSDAICTGLQLANFCQDVARDYQRGRIYLPLDACRAAGYSEDDFQAGRMNEAFHHLLAGEVDRAASYLHTGLPLVDIMPRRLRGDVWLFAHGGLAILERIRRNDYDVWARRPVVSKADKLRLLAGAVRRNLFGARPTSAARAE